MALSEEHFLLILKAKSQLGEAMKKDGKAVQQSTREMNRGLDEVSKRARDASGRFVSLGEDARESTSKAARGVRKMKLELQGLRDGARKVFRTLTPGWRSLAAGVLSVAAAQDAAARSSAFRLSMAEVATLAPDAAGGVAQLSKEVLALAVAENKLETDVAKGLYDARSAGFTDNADALRVLHASTKLATAGLATTAETVDLTTTSLNAYGEAADQADRVTQVWFSTVRQGKTTIPELAGAVGRVIPLAATLGVEIEELGASLATATAAGQGTNLAVTNLQAFLKSLLSRQKEVNAVFEKAGQTYSLATLRQRGLAHVVRVLSENTGDAAEVQEILGGHVEALNGFLALAGPNLGRFQANIDANRNSAEGLSKALDQIQGTDAFKVGQAVRAMKVETLEFGDAINSALADAIDEFGGLEAVQETIRSGLSLLTPVMERLVSLGAHWLADFREFAPSAEMATLKAELFLIKAEQIGGKLSSVAGMIFGDSLGRDAVSELVDQLAAVDRRIAAIRSPAGSAAGINSGMGVGGINGSRAVSLSSRDQARVSLLTAERARIALELEEARSRLSSKAMAEGVGLLSHQAALSQRRETAEKRILELVESQRRERERIAAIGGDMPMRSLTGQSFEDLPSGVPVSLAGLDLKAGPQQPFSPFPSLQNLDPAFGNDMRNQLAAWTEEEQKRTELQEEQRRIQMDKLQFSAQLHGLQIRGAGTDEERLALAQQMHEVQKQILAAQAEADGRTADEVNQLLTAFDQLRPSAVEAEQAARSTLHRIGEGVGDIAQSNLGDLFFDFIEGTKSGKEAFADFTRSVLRDMARLASQQLAMEIVGGVSGTTNAMGGVTHATLGASRPIPWKAYSMGGVASHPQVAVYGEGRRNEAFVPLPDNRRIPVTLQGGGGAEYHITVNMPVNPIDSRSFEGEIERHGKAVARAITREMQSDVTLRGQVQRTAAGR